MTTAAFDPVVHAPHRLQVCALLAPLDEAEFSVLRDSVGVSDSVLSKQLRTLEESGYVVLRKRNALGRLRTWVALTRAGRRAFAGHVAALQDIVQAAGPAVQTTAGPAAETAAGPSAETAERRP